MVGVEERAMFGGLSFLLHGNLACGVIGDDLCVRVGVDDYEEALAKPGAREFDFSGRPMRGWVMVAGNTLDEEEALDSWVRRGVDFAGTLPPK